MLHFSVHSASLPDTFDQQYYITEVRRIFNKVRTQKQNRLILRVKLWNNGKPIALTTTKRLLGGPRSSFFQFRYLSSIESYWTFKIFPENFYASLCGNASIPTDLSAHLASSLDQITSCCPNTNMPSRPPVSVVSYTSPDSVNTVSPCLICTLQ